MDLRAQWTPDLDREGIVHGKQDYLCESQPGVALAASQAGSREGSGKGSRKPQDIALQLPSGWGRNCKPPARANSYEMMK